MVQPSTDIVVPGSTSNLGAAFDALAVAVNLSLRARVLDVRSATAGSLEIAFTGSRPAGENRLETAFRLAASRFGAARSSVAAQVSSDIPMAAGLGSSAAAIVAGLKLYEVASGRSLTVDDMLVLATELEGHPDNAAAALLGGITVSCQCDDGRIIARAWEWPAQVRFVVATPESALPTKEARGVLPESVPLRDAVANLQRALLLVRALESGDYDDIREALKDRWHQPARGHLVPGLDEALTIDHPAVLGVCLSGAGPSVVALAAPGRSDEAAALLSDVYRRLDVRHTMRKLAAHPRLNQRLPVPAA
jgi:homoserine kinase